MELRHMRHFIAVAEELNFNRAAARLNMAQPPLSQSIRRLEDSLGVQLLDRSRRGVALTRAGIVFLGEARNAIKHADLARKLASREAAPTPEIRVSFTTAALYRLFPRLLVEFRDHAPGVLVQLHEQLSPLQVAPILSGDCDVGFVTSTTKGIEDFESLAVENARLVAAVPGDWPLAARKSIGLVELAEYPFILPTRLDYAIDSDATIALFRKAGVMPNVTRGDIHVSTTFTLVGAGLGCTVTTGTAALTAPHNVRFIPISDSPNSSTWGLKMIWRPTQLTQFGRIFVDFTSDYIKNNPSNGMGAR